MHAMVRAQEKGTHVNKAIVRAMARVLAAGLVAGSGTAVAETLDRDCGPVGAYRKSAWPAAAACATGLAQGQGSGPRGIPDEYNYHHWKVTLPNAPTQPVIGDGDTVFVGSGTRLLGYSATGTQRYNVDIGRDIVAAPAIGADGTIYVVATQGRVAARKADLSSKWVLDLPERANLTTPPLLGLNRAVYVTDALGNVVAIQDRGTSAVVSWKAALPAVGAKTALSRDGTVLYVGTNGGDVVAISTSNGARRWTTRHGSAITALAVLENGSILTGDSKGTVRMQRASDGAVSYSRALGGPVRALAIAPNGIIYALTLMGSAPNQRTQLWSLDRVLGVRSGFAGRNNLPATGHALLADAYNNVWGNFGARSVVGIDPAGYTFMGATLPSTQNFQYMAMNSQGAITYVVGFDLGQTYGGSGTRGAVPARVRVRFADSSSNPTVRQCNVPMSSLKGYARPGLEYARNGDVDSFTLTAADSGCPVQFCTDGETVVTNAAEIAAALATRGPAKGQLPTNLPSWASQKCKATSFPGGCEAVDPKGVRWDSWCESNWDCDAGQVCASVCPLDASTKKPQEQCKPDQMKMHCAKIDNKQCPTLPADNVCHEIRECAAARDKMSASEAEPKCNGASCAAQDAFTTNSTTSFTSAYQDATRSLWDAGINTCLLDQRERNTNTTDKIKTPSTGSNKNWGVTLSTDYGMKFESKPRPFGFLDPMAKGHAGLEVKGKVWGKPVEVLSVKGHAEVNRCKIDGQLVTKLFGQEISSLRRSISNKSECEAFFDTLEWGAGNIKNSLFLATRAVEQVLDGVASNAKTMVTREMCWKAYDPYSFSLPPQCQLPYTQERAAAVVNRLIDKYEANVKSLKPGGAWYNEAKRYLDRHTARAQSTDKFTTNSASGAIRYSFPLKGLGSEFNILGASAEFPIGPFVVLFEINAGGNWGVDGNLTLAANYLPPVSASATVGVEPHAGVDVDLYLGVGFGIPGFSVSFGMSGFLNLVELRAPLSGTASVTLLEVPLEYPNRPWPAAFSRYKTSTPLMQPTQFLLVPSAKLNAALQINALDGELEGMLRLQLAWLFKKTFKRRLAKLEGKTWTWEWMGSFNSPVSLGTVLVPVLDAIPYPKLPRVTASQFAVPTSTAWPTPASFSVGTQRTRALMIDSMPGFCEPFAW
jgi:hypothetical protein